MCECEAYKYITFFLLFYDFFFELPGIILKMASLIKEGGLRGHKARSEFVRKPPSKTFIIPADELVQVIAKVCLLLLVSCEFLFFSVLILNYNVFIVF